MPKAIILADGQSATSHLEDRHFIEVAGEPLIHRTIRQFSWCWLEVVTSNPDVIARLPEDTKVVPGSDESHKFFAADMIRKGLERCINGRNIVLFGDVFFTDDAAQTIKDAEVDGWAVYGRSGANPLTAPWAEYFAIEMRGMRPVRQGQKALEAIANYYMGGQWSRCSPWEWYFEMEDLHYQIKDTANVQTGEHWVEINDATDDIDFIEDAERLRNIA